MPQTLPGIEVIFIAGFGPVSESSDASTAFYVQTLGLPLKPMEGNADYLLTEESQLPGAKHLPSGRSRRRQPPVLAKRSGPLNTRYRRDGLNTRCRTWIRLPAF